MLEFRVISCHPQPTDFWVIKIKKIIYTTAIALLLTANANAASHNSWYATAEAGIGVGKRLNDTFSVEANLHRFHEFHFDHSVTPPVGVAGRVKQDISSTVLSFNINADLPSMHIFTPFISAGVGMSHNEADGYVIVGEGVQAGKSNNDLAWNAGAGVAVDTGLPVDIL